MLHEVNLVHIDLPEFASFDDFIGLEDVHSVNRKGSEADGLSLEGLRPQWRFLAHQLGAYLIYFHGFHRIRTYDNNPFRAFLRIFVH